MDPHEMARNGELPLESWKEIGAYLQRDATTVRRWEKKEGLPVHRHSHHRGSSVYAYPSEIDAWRVGRKVAAGPAPRLLWKIPAFSVTLLLCLIMAGNSVRPVSAQQAGSKAARQVWVTRTTDDPLAVSPDGRYIAFTDWQTGDLAVRDLTTGINRRLTNTSGGQEAEAAAFSADGREIAYNWFTFRKEAGRAGREPDNEEILVVPTAGGGAKRVWSSGSSSDYIVPYDWMPDGKQILVLYANGDNTSRLALLSVSRGSVLTLKSFGWQSFNASVSPDGKSIAYDVLASPTSHTHDIFVVATDGSRETAAVQNAADDVLPAWSADGSRILFLSDRTGQPGLWSVPFDNGKSGKEQLVKTDIGRAPLGTLSRIRYWVTRHGTLFYKTAGTGGPNIYSAELGSGLKIAKPPALAVESFVNSNGVPSLSPDGQRLAYRSDRDAESKIVIRTLKTAEERVVPSEIPTGGRPAWFPDGRTLLVLSNAPQGPGQTFYRLDLATGKATPLFRSPQSWVPGFCLSPDGKTVFYAEPFRLVRFDLETRRETELRKVDDGLDSFYSVSVSPDGKALAYVFWRGEPTSSIQIMPAAGGGSREVARANGHPFNGLDWSPDGKSLFFTPVAGDDGKNALWRVPASGGTAEQVGLTMPDVSALQIQPDGRRLFFVSNDTNPTEIWALENFLPKSDVSSRNAHR